MIPFIVLVRMRYDTATRPYVARRTAEGATRKESMRCLKRFITREAYQPESGRSRRSAGERLVRQVACGEASR